MYQVTTPEAPQVAVSNTRKRAAGASSGETSCAECRRSKQRCDKQWPCSNCRKRGCAAICPDGEIQPSSEKEARKFNTKLLLRQTALESQVEQLTNELKGLKEERRSTSLTSSPALSPTASLAVDQSIGRAYSRSSASTDQDRRDNDHSGETGGVLRLQKDGESIYIGAGGSSWALQQAVTGQESEAHPAYARAHYSAQLTRRSHPKPLMDPHSQHCVINILSSLPRLDEAKNLIHIYFRYVDWLYCIVSQQQIRDDLQLFLIPAEDITYTRTQRMAAVVVVLALGALFAPGRSLTSNQPWHLYDSARALLDHGLYLRHFTLAGVQTLHLSVSFLANNRDSYLAQEGWVLLGTAGRLSQAQGLHVDGSKWGLSAEELEARRRVFWELQTYDRLQALSQGRPVFAPLASCTTERPINVSPFDQQKYALAPLFERILTGISSPDFRYSEALTLDRRVREVEGQAPSALRSGMFSRLKRHDTLGPHEPVPLAAAHTPVQRHMHTLMVHKALLFLHRPWLGHILSQKIHEPLNSCFGISFSASIASAEALVENMSSALVECPHEARSFWFFMFHTFSAIVVLAACILRAPQSLHVLRTWEALEVAVQIFVDWPLGDDDHFVRRALPIVTQLHRKVRDLLCSTTQEGAGGEEHNRRLRELLGFRSTAAGQSRPGSPISESSSPLSPEQGQYIPIVPSMSSLPPTGYVPSYPNQPLEWDPSVLSLQNLPHMDLDGLLAGDAFQGDFVTQGLDWIFEL